VLWAWSRSTWSTQRIRRELVALGFVLRDGRPRGGAVRGLRPDAHRPVEARFAPAGAAGRARPWFRLSLPAGARAGFRLLRTHEGFAVLGEGAQAVAATSRALRAALGPGDRIVGRGGRVALEMRRVPPPRAIARLLPQLLEVAARTEATGEARARHLRAAFEEAEPGFEDCVLDALLDPPVTADLEAWVLARARRDARATVRLRAAVHTRDQPGLDALARDPETPEPVATRALTVASAAARWAVLRDRSSPVARREALVGAPRSDEWSTPAWRSAVAEIAEAPREPTTVRAAAIRAMGRGGHEAFEASLLRILEAPDAGTTRRAPEAVMLQTEALRALAAIGTERTLTVLHRLSDGAGLWAPLWVPAQAALTAVEARVTPPERGALSVRGGGDDGALSLPAG